MIHGVPPCDPRFFEKNQCGETHIALAAITPIAPPTGKNSRPWGAGPRKALGGRTTLRGRLGPPSSSACHSGSLRSIGMTGSPSDNVTNASRSIRETTGYSLRGIPQTRPQGRAGQRWCVGDGAVVAGLLAPLRVFFSRAVCDSPAG